MTDSPLLLLALMAALVAVPMVLRRLRSTAPGAVRVLGRTAVHKGAVLAVVAVGDRRLLVGTGEHGVQLLTELAPSPERTDAEPTSDPATTTSELPGTDTLGAITTTHDARKDASLTVPADLAALLADAPRSSSAGSSHAWPRIGLVDRLRAMTVRTPVKGRPIDVLRR